MLHHYSSFLSTYLCSRNNGPTRPPAEQMHMQVVDLLTAIRVAIDDQPITALSDAPLPREIARHDEHMPDQRFIVVGNIVGGGNGFVRDDQNVHRRCRFDVQKSD